MRCNRLPLVLALGLLLALLGCGNGNQVRPVNLSGNWTADMQKANGSTVFSFSSSINEVGNTVLNVSNLSFNPATSCFQSQVSASGIAQFSSSGYGYYTGGGTTAMALTVKGLAAGGGTDTLTLQGTANPDNTVSGTWTLNGVSAACSGSGGFTMTRH
ncbi:MAG TPA: hypothetical protein VET69_15975 [Terriglobales bacterium]|nr:hypothetical protein [Terriglobales bacterium]